jgi:outer membrane protein OmpA-like peptidoglycan-associated protein
MARRAAAATAALAALVLAEQGASAQAKLEGFALDAFDPSVPGDAFFGVPSPAIGGHLVPRFALLFDYAHQPLRLDLEGKGMTNIVAGQGFLRVDGSLALWDRLLVSFDVPAAVVQSGTDPMIANVDIHPPNKPAFGDIRFGVRGRFWGNFRDPFQIGASASIYVPSGSKDAYTGGATRAQFQLLLGGRAGSGVGLVWSAAGGVMVRAGDTQLATYGGAVGVVFGEDRVQIGPEIYGRSQLGGSPRMVPTTDIVAKTTSELEILGGAKVRLYRGLFLGAAAGTGPLAAPGAPKVRFVGSLAWAPLPEAQKAKAEVGDRDGDGIRDDVDACPDIKGELQNDPAKDGCPIADRDHDGVPDVDDACPNDAGPKNPDPTKNGCPPDADEDGVFDAVDACPTVKGVKSSDPKKNGCPADRDGDGIPDAVDACPDQPGQKSADPKWNGCPDDPDGDGIKGAADACPFEKGQPDPDPKQNGCPKYVRVADNEITISIQIQFKTNGYRKSETVSPVSEDVMKEIRDAILTHPEILKVEVQGHTDDSGTEEFNQRLSQERADAVRKWLIDAGVPAEKLTAKGYGYWKPQGDNRIRQGRASNRRVQFVILERKKP